MKIRKGDMIKVIAGNDKGKTTLVKMVRGEAPSMIAASIRSLGIFIKKFRIIRKYQPLTKVGIKRAKMVFLKFNESTKRN